MEKKKITPFRHDYYDLEEEEEVVFDPKPPKTLNKINQENIHMENKQMMGYGSFIISQKWHRLYRLNQWFDRKENKRGVQKLFLPTYKRFSYKLQNKEVYIERSFEQKPKILT